MYKRIRELREDNDILQKEIASALEIKQQQYQRYESGITEPPIRIIIGLAKFYNTSTDYILELTNNKKPSNNS